jgi:hypothetical protein
MTSGALATEVIMSVNTLISGLFIEGVRSRGVKRGHQSTCAQLIPPCERSIADLSLKSAKTALDNKPASPRRNLSTGQSGHTPRTMKHRLSTSQRRQALSTDASSPAQYSMRSSLPAACNWFSSCAGSSGMMKAHASNALSSFSI